MAKLTSSQRNALPTSAFALPKTREFPIHDHTHAAFAIPAATRSFHAGKITEGQMRAIQAKARAKLGQRQPGE